MEYNLIIFKLAYANYCIIRYYKSLKHNIISSYCNIAIVILNQSLYYYAKNVDLDDMHDIKLHILVGFYYGSYIYLLWIMSYRIIYSTYINVNEACYHLSNKQLVLYAWFYINQLSTWLVISFSSTILIYYYINTYFKLADNIIAKTIMIIMSIILFVMFHKNNFIYKFY
jgi:hypothetical protein